MPSVTEEPQDALGWLMQNLMKDLQEAKMWPIKLAHLKHQDTLRT